MKFQINKKIFDEVLEIVSKYSDAISTFYGFRCVLIEVTDEKIILKTSNDSINITKKIDVDDINVKVESTGKFLIQTNVIKPIIKKLSGNIDISTDNNQLLTISQGTSNYQVSLVNENSFPAFDNIINVKEIKINTSKLKKAIKSVIHAASLDNNLIYKCINIRNKNDSLHFTTTDSYRLALYQLKHNGLITEDIDISVVAKDLNSLIPIDAPEEITLFYNDIKVGIKYENTVITSRLVAIPFKDTEPLFENLNIKHSIQIEKAELNDLLNRVWLTNGDKQNRLSFMVKEGNLKITNNVVEVGSFVAATDKFKYSGDLIEFDLNYNFLKDAISIFDGEISILIDERVAKFLIISHSDTGSKQLITPLRR